MATVQDAITYAEQVVAGSIVSGKPAILACKRFIDDLENGEERGLRFDEGAAQHILDFYQFCRHLKGPLAGQAIDLDPWQSFILVNLFGWYWIETGFRRFRTAYTEVARKNGKSTFVAPVGLYLTAFDEEEGAEVYSAATKKDQAKIVFNDARQMVLKSPELKRVFGVHTNNLHVSPTYSKFEPLSADANSLDGLNVYGGIVDELHAHKSREVWDVLETATGARDQSLLFAITTAGFNKQGICYEQREYLIKVLQGVVEDDTYFGIIFTLDEGDDWQDESVWIKANPNLNVSVKIDDMRRLAKKAAEMPTARNNFLTKRLNIWVNTAVAWLDMERWQLSPKQPDIEYLRTLPCWVGMDLANKLDVAAVVAVFKDSGRYWIKCWFYLPEEIINAKSRTIATLYQAWADSGYLTLTEGNVIDHDVIEDDIREILDEFDVQEVAFDPWGSVQMANRLVSDGAPMIEVPQTVKNLSESMKEIEALVMSGNLGHGDNPVLNWMASNVVVKADQNENVFPRKEHPDNKIDGMVAMFNAMSRIIRHDEDCGSANPSVIVL